MEEEKLAVKSSVLNRIKAEGVCPRSRLWFQTRECVVWLLWLLSVLFGALAVAVSLFVIVYNHVGLFEATHDSRVIYMVDALPYLWIIILILMIGLAVFDFKQTKRGYRFPLWQIVLSSLLASFGVGFLLYIVGTGYQVDKELGKRLGFYNSQEKSERDRWQQPKEGRLLGQSMNSSSPVAAPSRSITFSDVDGLGWTVITSELSPYDQGLILSGERVKLFGFLDDLEPPSFYACGALLASSKPPYTQAERSRAVREAKDRWLSAHQLKTPSEPATNTRRCVDQAVMRRLE